MYSTEQHLEEASKTICACEQELMGLIGTFCMYGGRLTDIDRGDFDVGFFKDLHAKCSNIQSKLGSVNRLLAPRVR